MKISISPQRLPFVKKYASVRVVDGKPMSLVDAVHDILALAEGRQNALDRYNAKKVSPKKKPAK